MKKIPTYDYPIEKTRNFLGLKLKQKSGFNISDIEKIIQEIFFELISQLFKINFTDGKITISRNQINFELINELYTYNVSQAVINSLQTVSEEVVFKKTGLRFKINIFSQYVEELELEEYLDITIKSCKKVIETGEEILLPIMSKETRVKIHERLIQFPEIVSKSVNYENKRLILLKKKVEK
ncbi:hypothetical protein [Spiroplasma endosymbiont of Panorpa germanica]|uniref:hypothetical protein n=1 Tax=Spiroplasma endosymbiont of Panorpa germanica TaxID=3066314 RepID=UPI0030CECA73